jgi:hypothetical protein
LHRKRVYSYFNQGDSIIAEIIRKKKLPNSKKSSSKSRLRWSKPQRKNDLISHILKYSYYIRETDTQSTNRSINIWKLAVGQVLGHVVGSILL